MRWIALGLTLLASACTANVRLATQEIVNERATAGAAELDVQVAALEQGVRVVGAASSTVTATLTACQLVSSSGGHLLLDGAEAESLASLALDGTQLRFRLADRPLLPIGVRLSDLELIQPADLPLVLTVSSSNLTVTSMAAPVRVTNDSGNVDIDTSKSADLRVASGNLSFHVGESANIVSSSGGVTGALAAGSVTVASGNVVVEWTVAGDLTIEASSGNVAVTVSGDGFAVDAAAVSGWITLAGHGLAESGQQVQRTVGAGGPLLHVRTQSGNVNIQTR